MDEEKGLASLLRSLREGDEQRRFEAIHAIGREGSPEGMAALRDSVMGDTSPGNRKIALFFLGKNIDRTRPLFNEAVSGALKDPDLRWDAAWNLLLTGGPNPDVVEPLLRALGDNPTEFQLGMMLAALGKLQDRRAVDALARYLQSPDPNTRGTAAQALGDIGGRKAMGHLEALLDDRAIAWKEDYGPEMTVADIVRQALEKMRKRK